MNIPLGSGPISYWRLDHPDLTTADRVALLEATMPLLAVLIEEADAAARPAALAPPAIVAAARRLLRDCRRVLSQDDLSHGLLLLRRDISWTELRGSLKLARACLAQFTRRYRYFDDEQSEHVWATLERAELERDAEAYRAANGLPTHRVDGPEENDEADD